jgi:single-stranded-DNA-specific exonuclease
MLTKHWKFREIQVDSEIKSLADSLNISEILAKLLVLRDVRTFAEARSFFRPSTDDLYDPFLMDGMEIATTRILDALVNHEPICIYGDYDVDGTCSTALLYMFLKELDANVCFYIPKRLTEGYGISVAAIDYVKSTGSTLLISVDCGITAVEEARYAKESGIEMIICDHHQPKNELPPALAVLDPLKPSCNYPFKYLSGAGVAFKLAQGISSRIGKRDLPFKYLDLVALAGAADIVPLTDENRILVKTGMEQINDNPRPGILALIKSSGITPGQVSSGQVVFTIAPRINAVGRLGDAQRAVELFITQDKNKALELAEILESENYQRRKIDEGTYSTAMDLVDALELNDDLAIILHQENWHPGVIGIVASRLVEKYYKPTIMLTTIDGVAKGSARSVNNFNIYDALKRCEDLLIHFGGHQAAAGLAVEVDKIDQFRLKFNQTVKDMMNGDKLLPEILIDSRLKFSEITPRFLRIIEQFTPFGPGNLRPVFVSENVVVTGYPRVVGNNHLVVSLRQDGCDKVFDCIGFSMGKFCEKIGKPDTIVDIAFTIDRMEKDNKSFPQFRFKDIKIRKENNQEI